MVRTRTVLCIAALATLTAVGSGCGHKKRARQVPPPPPAVRAPQPGDVETGIASWYGRPYHGRPAADGEIYDMEKLVAAHRTLPFDTWVRVMNLGNQKVVEVRIIDRGPFVDGRIIDLSHAAAREIEMIGPGTAKVRVEVIQAPASAAALFAVQVGAYRDRQRAERVRADMAARFGSARLVLRTGTPDVWRVLVGAEMTQDGARALSDRILRESGERTALVVRLDS